MDALLVALIIFSAQLLAIVVVATVAEAVALRRVTNARLRLGFWRAVALACVALPLLAIASPDTPGPAVTFLAATLATLERARAVPVASVLPAAAAGTIVWWLLCVGAIARIGWLCVGAVRLRQLRRRSRAALLTSDLEALKIEVAPRAEVRMSCEIAQPAAFGLLRPVVLLPEDFFTMDAEAQRTVACHELLHVARRDWPWTVVEEMGRALFWFHPAVWWLVERIQQSREELVDRLVIARIPSKRAYMAALLAYADVDGGRRAATLATAFLRKRQLRSRLRKLVKESVMSRTRLLWTAGVLGSVMAGAIAGTAMALPLGRPMARASVGAATVTDAQKVVDGNDPGVTLPKVISEVKPEYTPEALKARIEGTLWLSAVVRTDGTPGDIEVTKSLDKEYGLDKQAVDALTQWRFEPGRKDGKPIPVRVTIETRFRVK